MIKLNPIAISATSQQYAVTITEKLCKGFCLANPTTPQASVSFSIGEITSSGTTAFVPIIANGTITYQPFTDGACCTKVEQFSEKFVVAFVGTGIPTITLTQGGQAQSPEFQKCCNKAFGWSITSDLTIAATF